MMLRVAMWSGPRNISTAMMRSWENRADTVVIDEPFYAHYLAETGLDHPGRATVLELHESDPDRIITSLTGPVPGDPAIQYQKHMTHHMLPGINREWMHSVVNCFLVRDPAEMLASLHVRTPNPSIEDTGLPQQVALFDAMRDFTGEIPLVLDARDVLSDPRGVLTAFCQRLGVPFDECMLSWPPGPRDSDGAWAPWWYDAVEASTGFKPWQSSDVSLPPALHGPLEDCRELYARLHVHRLTG